MAVVRDSFFCKWPGPPYSTLYLFEFQRLDLCRCLCALYISLQFTLNMVTLWKIAHRSHRDCNWICFFTAVYQNLWLPKLNCKHILCTSTNYMIFKKNRFLQFCCDFKCQSCTVISPVENWQIRIPSSMQIRSQSKIIISLIAHFSVNSMMVGFCVWILHRSMYGCQMVFLLLLWQIQFQADKLKVTNIATLVLK